MPLKVMKSLSELLLLCVLTSPPPLAPAWAFSQGATASSCASMEPGHIRAHSQDPRQSHVTLHTPAHAYLPGDSLSVVVRSTRDFMGFLLQARAVRDDRVIGSFVLVPPGSRTLGCVEAEDTVTHSDKLLKRNLSFIWRAPQTPLGDVRFLLTVVQSYFVYWARIESDVVHDGTQNLIEDGVGVEPGFWADAANWTSSADPSERPPSTDLQREQDPPVTPSLPTVSTAPPPAPPLPTPTPTPTGSGALTLHLDQAQTRAKTQRPSGEHEPCLHCGQRGQDPDRPADPSPGEHPQSPAPSPAHLDPSHSPTPSPTYTHLDPSPTYSNPSHSPTHPDPSPAPRRSLLDPTPPGLPLETTPGSRGPQKGVVTRNLSRGEDAGPGGAGEQGEEEESPGGVSPGGVSRRSALDLGVLLGCAAGLGMVLAVGLRYLHSQYCLKRTAVSLSPSDGSLFHLQDSGELVEIRKIRQNSFVLLQAEYNILPPPSN